MSLTLRQIEIFIEAARDGNFRVTADRLGISQPSVSSQILALEWKLGRRLFYRQRGRAAELSPDGRALLAEADGMLRHHQRLRGQDAADAPVRFALKVAAGPALLDRFIRPALSGFDAAHPDVELSFELVQPGAPMVRMIAAGEVDLVFYAGPPPAQRGLDVEFFGVTPCSIYVAPELGAEGHDLSRLPFLMFPERSPAEAWMLAMLAEADVRPTTVVARSQFPDVLAQMAVAGRGAAVLFDEAVAAEVESGALRRIGPALSGAQRVMICGRRARDRRAAGALSFLKAAIPLGRLAADRVEFRHHLGRQLELGGCEVLAQVAER